MELENSQNSHWRIEVALILNISSSYLTKLCKASDIFHPHLPSVLQTLIQRGYDHAQHATTKFSTM